ncbi:MAG: hypothetical protein Q9209_006305 [Squamulea sp. 1 TL-2023]
MQNVAFAVVAPIYFAIHLSTSPTVSSRKQSDYLPDPSTLRSIPYSVTIGFILPTILLALPAPSVVSYETKQLFMAIWQAFPLWVGALQLMVPLIGSRLIQTVTVKRTHKDTIGSMRTVYAMMLVIAIITRLSTWTMSICAFLLPDIFAPEVGQLLKPAIVFFPAAGTPLVKMPSIAAGALLFLQYDEMIGAAAMVLWGAILYVSAMDRKGPAGWALLVTKGVVIEALAGPQGFAVAAIWARDEIIFAGENEESKRL